MPLLTDAQILDGLKTLPGWTRDGASIRKQFTFASFPAAVDYVQRLVPGAEAADHHPDLTINYRRVTVVYSTHSDGGLTEKDFAGARTAEALTSERGTRPTA